MARSALLNVMVDAVRKAGRGLTRDYGEVENLQVSMKGPGEFVTSADRRAEKVLFEELQRARPGYGFLLEERGDVPGTDTSHRWIIDAVDGTVNLVHALPFFCISVALERNGVIVAGVMYNPVLDELYVSERGAGAFVNDRRMRVANRSKLHDCVVGTFVPHIGHDDHMAAVTRQKVLMNEVAGVRAFGSTGISLAYVAAGRLDAYVETAVAPWHSAAGLLMVREAGGFVSDLKGKDKIFETRTIVAGNEDVHRRLLAVLAA